MDGAALPPAPVRGHLGALIASAVLGIVGSLAGIAAFGHGTYPIGPLSVELSVKPGGSGTTELAVAPAITGLDPGHTTTNTHSGYLQFRGTVVGITRPSALVDAKRFAADPFTLATFIRDDGQVALKKVGIRAGIAALAGGAAGGGAIALFGMRPKRVLQSAIAGVAIVAILGVVAWRTYNVNSFARSTFTPAGITTSAPSG
jgi:hypothetical protein